MNNIDATPIARAFVYRALNLDQKQRLKKLEDSTPPGRYLTPSEIGSLFSLSFGEITPEQETAMQNVWNQYRKILWKQQKIEEVEHDKRCAAGKCLCRTYQQELHDWQIWAEQHYDDPIPVMTSVVKNMARFAGAALIWIR